MPLELREVTSPKEIPEIIQCLFESFGDPDTSFYYLVCPITGSSTVAKNDRVVDYSMREWFDHSGDPTSHWIKVVDTDNNDKVVASMRWNIHREDPFGDDVPAPSAFWLREGPTRRFTESVVYNLCKLRFRKQPHLCRLPWACSLKLSAHFARKSSTSLTRIRTTVEEVLAI